MRAELTAEALRREPNPYLLAKLIAKATRKLHQPNARVQDTMNYALVLFNDSNSNYEPVTLEPASVELRQVA
jgi:hypothetical protein